MRRWPLIVVLTASLAFGATACGLKEGEDAGDLATRIDPTTEPGPGAAGPATDDPATDDPATDDSTADDPAADDGSGDDSSGDDPFGDDSSGDDGSGGSGSGDDDFCSLAEEIPDPTSVTAGDEFFERWRAAAPEELDDEVDVVVDWYQQSKSGGSTDLPEDVLDALIAISQYTIENCT